MSLRVGILGAGQMGRTHAGALAQGGRARIVAVADSFDAMTTLRPYRKVLSPLEAFQEIEAGGGVQYDPAIVKAFRWAWDAKKITAIFEAFP